MIDPDRHLREGSLHLLAGAYAEAAACYDLAAREYLQTLVVDDAVLAAVAAARVYLLAGAPAHAEALLEALERLAHGTRAAGHWALARAEVADHLSLDPAVRRERWQRARAVTSGGLGARAARGLGAVAWATGHFDEAVACFQSSELEAADDADRDEALLLQAEAAAARGRPEVVAALLDRAAHLRDTARARAACGQPADDASAVDSAAGRLRATLGEVELHLSEGDADQAWLAWRRGRGDLTRTFGASVERLLQPVEDALAARTGR